MKFALPLIAALAAPLPAFAQGFNAADLKQAALSAEAASTTARLALLTQGEDLRLALVTDVAAALAVASPDEASRLRQALALGDASGDIRARWFMAGAIASADPAAQTTSFYNPLARGWLVLTWQEKDGAIAIADARLVSATPSDWASKPGSYLGNLVADYRATSAVIGDGPGEQAGFEADRFITGVALWLRDPVKRAAMEAARKRIAAGKTGKQGGDVIDQMPAEARASFGPIAALQRAGGGGSVLFGSALMPKLLIAADLGDGAAPVADRFTLVNLGAVE